MISGCLEELLKEGQVFDLSQDLYPGMPHHPNQAPFGYTILKTSGHHFGRGKNQLLQRYIHDGGHTGTHMDAVAHVARDNTVFDNVDIAHKQDYQNGLQHMSIDVTPPFVKRGVLLDIPALVNEEVLPSDFGIGQNELKQTVQKEGITIEKGDVALIRTGWIKYWSDIKKYLLVEKGVPGVTPDGGRYLVSSGISLTGSDTTAYDKVPPHHLPCYVIQLVENGIKIMEMLNLDELSR